MSETQEHTGLLRGTLAPILGMSMFWPLFRYASYARVLYPNELDAPLGSIGLSAHVAFIAALAVFGALSFARWRTIAALFHAHRRICAFLFAFAAAGAGIAAAVNSGSLAASFIWISIFCAAVGFLAAFFAWAVYFTARWDRRAVMLLAASFWLSYMLFSHAGAISMLLPDSVAAIIMPLGSGLGWLLCKTPPQARTGEFLLKQCASPVIIVVGAMLVVGGAVRGIVDLDHPSSSLRFITSLVLTSVLLCICVLYWKWDSAPSRRVPKENRRASIFDSCPRLALILWLGLSVLFLAGLFMFLVMDDKRAGGDIVIVSRSSMEFVLWILVCDLARHRRLEAVPAFCVNMLSVVLLSWMLSYGIVPALFSGTAQSDTLSANAVVLAVLFGIVGIGLVGFGVRVALSDRSIDMLLKGPQAKPQTAQAREAREPELHGLLTANGLTTKEASVAVLYSQGYSLAKVADLMGITKATAQSHIKGVYRKLAVHSRDELIERIGSL